MFVSPGSRAGPRGRIPRGSQMLFFNATAPVGWAKSITHNDKAIRIVNGTGGGAG